MTENEGKVKCNCDVALVVASRECTRYVVRRSGLARTDLVVEWLIENKQRNMDKKMKKVSVY